MTYDFKTLISRKNIGAEKWEGMRKISPNIGEDIIPFSVADMELKNPPEIIEGLKEYLDSMVLGYTSATDNYYNAVCSWMQRRHKWEINKDWIVEFAGVVPALFTIVKALTNPKDGVMVMTPVYSPFYSAIISEGRTIVKTPLVLKGNQYEVDFEDFEEKARMDSTKMLILCNPHNPVGRVWTKEELVRIGRICIDNNVLIVSDEIHFDIIMPEYEHTVFASISKEFEQHSIICTAPSKTFNLAGLQTSNIIIPNSDIRKKINKFKQKQGDFMLNIFGYKACEIAYTKCEEWLEQLIELLSQNKSLLVEFIEKNIPEIKVIDLQGTYLQWIDCRALGMDYKKLEEFMQKEALLFLNEGYVFGEEGQGFERINLACPTEVLQKALDRLLVALNNR